MSLPLILCYKRSNTKQKRIIEYILSKTSISKNDFDKIVKIMNYYSVKEDCLNKAKHFSIMAKDSLGIFEDSLEKDKMIRLVNYLIERHS